MTQDECIAMLDFLRDRFRRAGMQQPFYRWGVVITWEKIRRWCELLGYQEESKKGGDNP